MDVCYTVHINYITCMISNGGLLFLMCGHFYHGFLIVNFFGQPPPTFLVAAAYGAHLTSSPQDNLAYSRDTYMYIAMYVRMHLFYVYPV